jgi:hypothetical protein
MTSAGWEKLRKQVKREQRQWENTKLNKEGRTVAAGMAGAYAGVLRMMDRIEKDVSETGSEGACEICDRPLDESAPWQRGLDGCAAHESCLAVFLAAD